MPPHSTILKTIWMQWLGLLLNRICYTNSNLLITIGKNKRRLIIVFNEPPMYKSRSGQFFNYWYRAKHMWPIKKCYTTSKQVFEMKSRFNLWFSSPRTLNLHVKLLIGLVVVCSIYRAKLVTNTMEKADTATKVLQIIQIASIFYTSDSSSYRTLKGQALWN